MNPTRKRRLIFVLLLLAAAGVTATFLTLALQENLTYLHTPSEVRAGQTPATARFRLGGVVCDHSLVREAGTLRVAFRVTDRAEFLPVRYEGILPDLFGEGQSILATGRMEGEAFRAEEVLAKHDETYMPKEVADKMAQARARPDGAGCGEATPR